MDGCGEVKEALLLVAIEVPADLRAILAVVGILRGGFDDVDMSVFCWVSRPLNWGAGPTDAFGDAVEEFKFRDEKVVEGLVPFPNPCPGIKDGLLVLMKNGQGVGYLCDSVTVDGSGLSEVAEVR